MKIADLIGIYEQAKAGNVTIDQVGLLKDCLAENSLNAKAIILQRISEKDVVAVRSLVKKTILAIMLSSNEDGSALLSTIDTTYNQILDGLLDTYFMAMVGLMIQEEIL